MIKFHPGPEQLTRFVEGTLLPVESIMVSAHCDMCRKCRDDIDKETARIAENEFLFADEGNVPSLETMLAQITELPASTQLVVSTSQVHPTAIELDGKSFPLPATLHRFISKTGNWSSLVGRLWQAPVSFGHSGVANFIYMGKGGGVPEHTHQGIEYSLVISGEFSDNLNTYRKGDFLCFRDDQTHAPHSQVDEGCLMLTVLDRPVQFTSGIVSLLNPFSALFFGDSYESAEAAAYAVQR
ncbi:anti-sigma factor [Alteromonas pelagimontana]|uniref:Anti-sigma factor n=1 Tax=Alteromonas pelagimontana TaxID=1858656 RepID=A0A6M4MHR9_9ALTE|nr:ChrR family anti-sigma-E factor [Alteromonas pelagimontana]QJR82125.1 anti-sigma factor [Alteromonas pelagimontana]